MVLPDILRPLFLTQQSLRRTTARTLHVAASELMREAVPVDWQWGNNQHVPDHEEHPTREILGDGETLTTPKQHEPRQDRSLITVEEFLKSNMLKRSDVMLARHKKALFSKLIMWGTKSSWSHVTLIFEIPRPESGFENTIVLESGEHGARVTNLRYYLIDHAKEYDVAFKRLESEWFANDDEGKRIRKGVRDRMLNIIRAEYDMETIFQIAKMIVRKFLFGLRVRFQGFPQAIESAHEQGRVVPSQFVSSGFVQYGYYDAIRRSVQRGTLPQERLEEVIFHPHFTPDMDPKKFLATTPQDLAATDKLTWKYFIKGGLVYEVSSNEEVEALIND